jgi:hypothetical protein
METAMKLLLENAREITQATVESFWGSAIPSDQAVGVNRIIQNLPPRPITDDEYDSVASMLKAHGLGQQEAENVIRLHQGKFDAHAPGPHGAVPDSHISMAPTTKSLNLQGGK